MKKLWGVGFILGAVFAVGLFSLTLNVIAATFTSQDVNYPIYIDNTLFTPSTPAQNVNGSTYLPLRAMSEALGVKITWDATERRVDVYKNLTEETKNVPDLLMWDFISQKTNNLFLLQQTSATTAYLDDTDDAFQLQLMYFDKSNPEQQILLGKLNLNFTAGTFDLLYAGKDSQVNTFKGSFDNNNKASNITSDGGKNSDAEKFLDEKLVEYKTKILQDEWNLKLVGLKPSDMKTKKLVEYVK